MADVARALFLALAAAPVFAMPSVSRMDEPDKQGILHYTVKCEGGGATLVECLRDENHCGYSHDQSVTTVAEQACERIQQSRPMPASDSRPEPQLP